MTKYYADKILYKEHELLDITDPKRRFFYDLDSQKCYKETKTKNGLVTEEIGIYIRSSSGYDAYGLYIKGKARGYASVCRLVASCIFQSQLQYAVDNDMVVHHIDRNIHNNHASNLVLIERNMHNIVHTLVKKFHFSDGEALQYVVNHGGKMIQEIDWIH